MKIKAYKIETSRPDDLSGLKQLIADGVLIPKDLLCIIGKTEGNGGRNDFTRDLAMHAYEDLFSRLLGISRQAVTDRIIFSLSGGCEGVVTPHIIAFTREGEIADEPCNRDGSKGLAVAIGYTREFAPQEIGRMAQIKETARVITQLMQELKLDSASDVHLIQMKGAIPSYTYEQGLSAARSGKPMRSDMVYSRGASALAAACAMQEIAIDDLNDEAICSDYTKYSSVASCSAKPGLKRTEVMLFANSRYAESDLTICSTVLNNMIDSPSIHALLREQAFDFEAQLSAADRSRIVGTFAKSEADPTNHINGKRHTMLTDDDISDTRYSRCVLSSVIASITGDTTIYVSTRAEHHGPSGGGTFSMILRK